MFFCVFSQQMVFSVAVHGEVLTTVFHCQGPQNGSPPDVNSRGGHPGSDRPSQLQHGRQPTPAGLLFQVHHLEI